MLKAEPVGRANEPYDTDDTSRALSDPSCLLSPPHLPPPLQTIHRGPSVDADPPVKVPWSNSRCEHPPSLSFTLSLSHTFLFPTSTTSHPPPLPSPHAATSFPFPFLVKKSQTGAGRRTFHQRRQESVFGSLCMCASSGRWNSRLSINSVWSIYTHTHRHRGALVLTHVTFYSLLLHTHGFFLTHFHALSPVHSLPSHWSFLERLKSTRRLFSASDSIHKSAQTNDHINKKWKFHYNQSVYIYLISLHK